MSSNDSTDDHRFIPAKSTDSRAPCPALNALANQGYLPRDGKDLKLGQLVGALRDVYNLSTPLAFALSLGGILRCGRGFRLDLDALAAHNVIEHDGSLVHADAAKGSRMAPIPVDTSHLERVLSYSSDGHSLSVSDWARLRADIEGGLQTPLGSLQTTVAHGEVALTMKVMQNLLTESGTMPLETIKQWFGEERLPDGWKKPDAPVGFTQVHPLAGEIGDKIKQVQSDKTE